MSRRDVGFESHGVRCAGWLYEAGAGSRPCVVMAHGFGGTMTCRLAQYAERFQAAGYHALVFDYRHFGQSEGEPRQLLSISRQLDDYAAAIAYARSLPSVDPARIVLWGTSFSGGHVIVAGARDGRVACVVAQCPMMDGLAAVVRVVRSAGLARVGAATWLGLRDVARAALRRPPYYLPIIGAPGTLAMMTTPDAEQGFEALAGPDFDNRVAARVALETATHRPVRHAHRLRCPALIQICEHDSVAPASASEKLAARLGSRATVKRYPIGHFDVYVGSHFERSISDQLAFVREHVGAVRGS